MFWHCVILTLRYFDLVVIWIVVFWLLTVSCNEPWKIFFRNTTVPTIKLSLAGSVECVSSRVLGFQLTIGKAILLDATITTVPKCLKVNSSRRLFVQYHQNKIHAKIINRSQIKLFISMKWNTWKTFFHNGVLLLRQNGNIVQSELWKPGNLIQDDSFNSYYKISSHPLYFKTLSGVIEIIKARSSKPRSDLGIQIGKKSPHRKWSWFWYYQQIRKITIVRCKCANWVCYRCKATATDWLGKIIAIKQYLLQETVPRKTSRLLLPR